MQTSLNRTWVLKIGIFALVMIGFGILSVVDAAWLYPARGLADATERLRLFIVDADKAGLLRADKIATPDPRTALAMLETKAADLRRDAQRDTTEGRAAQMELDRLDWLQSLHRAWKLDTATKPICDYTSGTGASALRKRITFDPATGAAKLISSAPGGPQTTTDLTPQALLSELNTYAASAPKPTPLSGWDLPMQWSFVLLGFGVGGYLVYLLAKCARIASKFRFDSAEQRLTLATGQSLIPADLQDIDKRLWHKFYVTLITNDGEHHKLDLLRYVPLEEWILTMERTRFPDRVEEDKPEEPEAEAPPDDAQPAQRETPMA